MVAIPSAVTVFFVGHRITPLLRPWSTTTRRVSKPFDKVIQWWGHRIFAWMVGSVPRGWGSGVALWGVCLFCFVGKWNSLLCISGYIGPFWATNILQSVMIHTDSFLFLSHLLHSDSYLSRLWLIAPTLTPPWLIYPYCTFTIYMARYPLVTLAWSYSNIPEF